MHILIVLLIASIGSINSQFVFPNQPFFNSLPIFPNQFPYPYNPGDFNRNRESNTNNNNYQFNPQQITTTTNRPYFVQQQPTYQPYQPYQQQINNIQQTTTTTKRTYNLQAPQQNAYQQGGKRISEQKCDEYSNKAKMSTYIGSLGLLTKVHTIKADQCDKSQGLIIGGVNTRPGEFPHMAAIGYKDLSNVVSFSCGGSLISERFVLTAAHCRKTERADASLVRVGDLNLKVREDSLPELDIPIDRFIVHEQYDQRKQRNDIAVVKLSTDVPIGKFIRPACLMTTNTILQSKKVVATGWGLTKAESKETSDILQKVDLSIINNAECNRLYEDYENSIDNTQLCAGDLQGGKDTCQGDSGGPLQIISNSSECVFVIVGVTSFGRSCGLKYAPGVYTKVSSYLDWIENKVWRS